jgi:hypothetical protein
MSDFFQRGTALALFLSMGLLASYGQFTLRGRIVIVKECAYFPVSCQRYPGPEHRLFTEYFSQPADRDHFHFSASLLDAFGDLEFCQPGQTRLLTARDGLYSSRPVADVLVACSQLDKKLMVNRPSSL